MSKSIDYEAGFPSRLWECERAFLAARRDAVRAAGGARPPDDPGAGDRPPADATGVALSGGGIRSATFCLGVFQALAKRGLVGRIDYLSTVSGGGYFGTFFGALFARPGVGGVPDVEDVLRPDGVRPSPTASAAAPLLGLPDVLRWLRENGRYLSPNGSGDLLVGGAIMFRNWLAIHVVLITLVTMAFLLLQIVRAGLPVPVEQWFTPPVTPERGHVVQALWWSPFVAVPIIPLLLVVVPTAWAYWLVGASKRKGIDNPLVGFVLTEIVVLVVVLWPGVHPTVQWIGYGVLGEVALVLITWFVAWRMAQKVAKDAATGAVAGTADEGFVASEERNLLSRGLLIGLALAAVTLVVGLVDSVGQSVYLAVSGATLAQALGGLLAVLAGAASVGRRIAVALGRGTTGAKRVKLPMAITAGAVAVAIIGVVLIAIDVLTHSLAWRFCAPATALDLSWVRAADAPARTCITRDGDVVLAAWVVGVLLSLVFGRSWPFLNNSSLHAMYSARLTRAYLGASNPERATGEGQAVTRVRPGDNFTPDDYWLAPGTTGPAGATAACDKGAPLHLINVTVNETVDGRSQIQQLDRKGMGLAIGPCAVTVGVRHHAIFPSHAALRAGTAPTVAPPKAAPPAADDYRVFEALAGGGGLAWRGGERLTVGQWVGISGAAFSTGVGARTSLGLSLLCGFANVRLGYWWESGVVPPPPPIAPSRPRRALEWLFPLQVFLIKEFLSQFPGTAYTRWYLSDGGHFENMGGYELVRRRLPRMLIVDAEADPEYSFEGLSNFVRKARLDFGAEVAFLEAAELDAAVPGTHRHLFGTLEELRRGRWADEPINDAMTGLPRVSLNAPVDQTRYSRAHAALARVMWADEPAHTAWLLYIKPTLTGDERTDVLEYHRAHEAFPQETTGDQFFDEAQWESYRMLGFEIADAVFAPGAPSATGQGGAGASPSPQARIFG